MEEFMLPCLNKKIFGIDCLGCGMQRATALLFRGEFVAAFKMYPAIYSLIALAVFLMLTLFIKIRFSEKIKLGLIVLNVVIIIVSYLMKVLY